MKLSIITVNKNDAIGLEKTIQNIIEQTFKDFEYIVIDGNSSDGSVEIIKKYNDKINYWISEPDTGIYNAMNKGIQKANGNYCLFLNSKDLLISSTTLQDVFNEITDSIPADIFYSDATLSDGRLINYPESITINQLINFTINHQNCLIKHSLFLEHGLYNEDFCFISDWEFLLIESYKYKSKFVKIKTNISVFDINGIGTLSYNKRIYESKIMLKNVFQELSEPIIELNEYHNTIYYYIIKNYGNTKILTFFLRIYRYIIVILKKLKIIN